MRVLLIGKSSGRLACLADAIRRSRNIELFISTNYSNSNLTSRGFVEIGPTEDPDYIENFARVYRRETGTIAIISNEEPLATGVVDRLISIGVPTVGPTQALAQIETSKHFCRQLLDEYSIIANPLYAYCRPGQLDRAVSHMNALLRFVIKPDGLTGGKGVRVMGDHFSTIEQGTEYCREILDAGGSLLIEEKLEGPEFSLMSFSDGTTIVDMPAVQDHKRLLVHDVGPNTGGMGSYSDADHCLPFLTKHDLNVASFYNRKVIAALQDKIGQPYRGILYGNYIYCRKGIRLIEFNARFGDPEVMNVLPLLETDFGDIAFGIAHGRLRAEQVRFAPRATVCKYLVPDGHPDNPQPGRLDLSQVAQHPDLRIYYGALDGERLTGSRAAAVIGIGDTIAEAERIAETAAQQTLGPLHHRSDIGTAELIEKRVAMATRIRDFP
jgi:phosphoribosylamine--glycine ligase